MLPPQYQARTLETGRAKRVPRTAAKYRHSWQEGRFLVVDTTAPTTLLMRGIAD